MARNTARLALSRLQGPQTSGASDDLSSGWPWLLDGSGPVARDLIGDQRAVCQLVFAMVVTKRATQGPHPAAAAPVEAMQQAALAYAGLGWSVIPIEPRGGRPLVAWLGLQHRVAGPSEIDAWFRRWPDANVGVVTGSRSGLVVLEVDARHGGLDSLAQAVAEHGVLPRGPELVTAGGGLHFYFRHPGLALHNRVGLRPGIDLRADGGCVVAPPSLHASGQRYRWTVSPQEASLADLPVWVAHAVQPVWRVRPWQKLAHQGVAGGARNATLASLCGHLLGHGIEPAVALELLLAWNRVACRPPLGDDEVARVLVSIAPDSSSCRQPTAPALDGGGLARPKC